MELFNSLSAPGAKYGSGYKGERATENLYSANTLDDPYSVVKDLGDLAKGAAFAKYGAWGAAGGPSGDDLAELKRKAMYENASVGEPGGIAPGVNWVNNYKKWFGL